MFCLTGKLFPQLKEEKNVTLIVDNENDIVLVWDCKLIKRMGFFLQSTNG